MAKVAYESIVVNEKFDYNKFKAVVKELNESGLTKKVNPMGKKEAAVKSFLDAVEKIPEEDVGKMPDTVYEMNNDFIDILDGGSEVEEEEEEKEEGKSENVEKVKVEGKTTKVKEKKAKASKPLQYTRSNALVDSLPNEGKSKTKEQMISLANDQYIANDGSDNLKVAKALLGYVLPSLLLLGILKEENGEYIR